MANGLLACDIPTLEPDDDLLDLLAGLAAASAPSGGGSVVPIAFGGPAGRGLVLATAVAAVTAGGAAAATQQSRGRPEVPAPPGRSAGIQRPDQPAPGVHAERAGHAAPTSTDHQPAQAPPDTAPHTHLSSSTGDDTPDRPSEPPRRHQGSNDPGDGDRPGGAQDGDTGNPSSGDNGDNPDNDGDSGSGNDGGGNDGGSGQDSSRGPSSVAIGRAD
jgi:hypothetical protein